jgi:hypothetical protein
MPMQFEQSPKAPNEGRDGMFVNLEVGISNVVFHPAIPKIKQGHPFTFKVIKWDPESSIERIHFDNFRELAQSSAGYHKVGPQLTDANPTLTADTPEAGPVSLDSPVSPQERLVSCDMTLSVNGAQVTIDPPLDEKP